MSHFLLKEKFFATTTATKTATILSVQKKYICLQFVLVIYITNWHSTALIRWIWKLHNKKKKKKVIVLFFFVSFLGLRGSGFFKWNLRCNTEILTKS